MRRLQRSLAEVDIPEDDTAWSTARWLQSVEDYQQRLDAHLMERLLDRGKAALSDGDHLTALRLLNRLLSIDSNNQEVLSLLRGMHADMPSTRRWTKVWPVSVGLVFVVGLLVHWAWPQDAPSRVVEAASASTTDADLEDDRPQDIDTPPAVVATMNPSPASPPPPSSAVVASKTVPPPDVANSGAPAVEPADAASLESMGSVIVTVPGSWGDIFVDGKLRGRTGQVGAIGVAAGTHTLEIRNDHALPHQQTFTVEPENSALSRSLDCSGSRSASACSILPHPTAPSSWMGSLGERSRQWLAPYVFGPLSDLTTFLLVPGWHQAHEDPWTRCARLVGSCQATDP